LFCIDIRLNFRGCCVRDLGFITSCAISVYLH